MDVQVVALAEPHFASLRAALDVVAREKRYLAFTQAPAEADAFAFYRAVLAGPGLMRIAVYGGAVVGWCDVLPAHGQARAHVGVLGIGVLPEYRGRGLGRRLLESTIAGAWDAGFARIELTVRADNLRAKALYRHIGFVDEGCKRGDFRVDGQDFDSWMMALLR